MSGSRYALVAYVRDPVGKFVEKLRRELHPELPHLAAHLTILPPRLLRGSEEGVTETLPYIPHLTIAKMSTEEQAWKAFEMARRRWMHYHGSRHILLSQLTFVREVSPTTGPTWPRLRWGMPRPFPRSNALRNKRGGSAKGQACLETRASIGRKDMSGPSSLPAHTCIARKRFRRLHKEAEARCIRHSPGDGVALPAERFCMHVGVYGSGYLGTV